MIVLALMRRYGIPETLDAWLEIHFAGVDMTKFVFDPEMLESVPEQFRGEFVRRFCPANDVTRNGVRSKDRGLTTF